MLKAYMRCIRVVYPSEDRYTPVHRARMGTTDCLDSEYEDVERGFHDDDDDKWRFFLVSC